MRVTNPTTNRLIDKTTLDAYQRRAEQLLRQYARTNNIDPNAPSEFGAFHNSFCGADFCDWFLKQRASRELSPSTWRQYRASASLLLHSLLITKHPGVNEQHIHLLNSISLPHFQEGSAKWVDKTSKKKKKHATDADFKQIDSYLLKAINGSHKDRINKLDNASVLRDFLKANMALGLRVKDYAFAFTEDSKLTLTNISRPKRRPTWDKKVIDLSRFSDDVIQSILNTVINVQSTYFPSWEEKSKEMGEMLFNLYNDIDAIPAAERFKKIDEYSFSFLTLDETSLPMGELTDAREILEKISEKPIHRFQKSLEDTLRKVTRRVFRKRTKSPIPTLTDFRPNK